MFSLRRISLIDRIIPAYAGSTESSGLELRSTAGSSPHTRGALARKLLHEADHGIIPAYAGSTGEQLVSLTLRDGSSPHTRGAHIFGL